MTTRDDVLAILADTTVPRDVATSVVAAVPELWLLSESSAELLGSDLALCHPWPKGREVRARAVPVDWLGTWRVTIVARDRPGLLADTAGTLAAAGIPVIAASALTLHARRLALHSLTIDSGELTQRRWEQLGRQLRAAANGRSAPAAFRPSGAAEVTCTGHPNGLHLLTVSAPDQLGLLSAICQAVAAQSVNIEVAQIVSRAGRAEDLFLVDGEVEVGMVATRLSASGRSRVADVALDIVDRVPVVGGLAARLLTQLI